MILDRPSLVRHVVILSVFAPLVCAQSQTPTTPDPVITPVAAPALPTSTVAPVDSGIHNAAPATQSPPPTPQDKHIFGVLPNYRTAESTQIYRPITTKQKFTIAKNDTLDGPGFALAAVFAGLYQLENQNPSFGQGIKGYAHRYVTAYGDQAIGNMMTEGILPSLLHEDPRYFRRGRGSIGGRTFYAVSRVVVTRTDVGGTRFNVSEFLGNGIDGAIGNAYYPDERGFGDTIDRMFVAIGTDAISDILKEFWPDFKKHVLHKKSAAE